MADAPSILNPTDSPSDIEFQFNRRRLRLDHEISLSPQEGLRAQVAISPSNTTANSAYSIALSLTGMPGKKGIGAGVRIGYSAFWGGVTTNGIFTDSMQLEPQVGIGPLSLSPTAGICGGFLCAGSKGIQTAPPVLALIISAVGIVKTMAETQDEDLPALPVIIASMILSNFIPINAVADIFRKTSAGASEKELKAENLRALAIQRKWMEMRRATSPLPSSYEALHAGINSIIFADRLRRTSFPGEYGDFGLLTDNRRASEWTRHPEIVDAFYQYAAALKKLRELKKSGNYEDAGLLAKMIDESLRDIIQTVRENTPQARREWEQYVQTGNAYIEDKLKRNLINRISEALDSIQETEILLADIDSSDKKRQFTDAVAAMKRMMKQFKENAASFRLRGFGGEARLYSEESDDSEKLRNLLDYWNDSVVPAYSEFSGEIASSSQTHGKKLELAMAKTTAVLGLVRINYERFNMKRIGAYFLAIHLRKADINPAPTHQPQKTNFGNILRGG